MRTSHARTATERDAPARILEAALVCFARDGYDGAKMRDIASRAGVPLGLLRYHFGGKLKLWQASVDRAVADIQGGLDTPLDRARAGEAEEDELSVIRQGIRNHVRYVARHPEFVRLMHDEGKRRGPRMRWLVDRHVKPFFARLMPMIEHLQSVGRLPADIEPAHFTYCLIGAIDTIFHQAEECRRVTGLDPADPAVVESHARAVEFMLLGSATSEPSSTN